MAEIPLSPYADLIRAARERMEQELRAQAEQLQIMSLELTELRRLHERTEQEASRQWAELEGAAARFGPQASPEKALEDVLGAVRSLMTCTMPELVFEVLTEEASEWGVRAAVFDVRGKAAWGTSAHGFGPALSEKVLHSLVIPLNQDNPFRQVCESAGHVDASADTLKKNRNVLDKLRPHPQAPVLLLPIRAAGTVAAIFYADPGEKGRSLPVNALKVLAEFAGAQIDRLIALSGGFSADSVPGEIAEAPEPEAPGEEAAVASAEPPVEEPVVEEAAEPYTEVGVVSPPGPPARPAERAREPQAEVIPPPPPVPPVPPVAVAESPAPQPPAHAVGLSTSQHNAAEEKVHKDAKRFARLLVSEIELYNKGKVAEGRKNRDLYERLKSDIDRSRQTFEKRYGQALNSHCDYFHEELVKTLAANDSAVLGPQYPGPSA
ncbi:MAG: hypothetical protein WAO35_10585 [Terriglobia bacterium]